jgi:hypothetical protein
MSYIEPIFKKDDPKEFFIAANEFAYNISNDKLNMLNACYWIEWTIEFNTLCKKKKNQSACESRTFVKVDPKLRNDIIWILWECIIHYSNYKSDFIQQVIQSLFTLFCIKYSAGSNKKRRYILYFAVSLLTEPIKKPTELVNNKKLITNVVNKINMIYKEIKKNEHSPNTDYLFSNLDKKNTFERSLKQLEIVNSVDIGKKI